MRNRNHTKPQSHDSPYLVVTFQSIAFGVTPQQAITTRLESPPRRQKVPTTYAFTLTGQLLGQTTIAVSYVDLDGNELAVVPLLEQGRISETTVCT